MLTIFLLSELSKLDSIEYCGRDLDNAPGVILRKGSMDDDRGLETDYCLVTY